MVLLPAFESPEEVQSAFDWFSSESIDDGRADYVFVSTAREVSNATASVCASVTSTHKRFHHLHGTRMPYCKATQLNEAVEWSLERWPDEDLRFAIYDIDGRPETLPNRALDGTFADIEQQVPLPARPSMDSSSRTGRGHAAVQSVRALATEFNSWTKAQSRYGKQLLLAPLLSPAKYCWGNGLVIRAQAFEKIGGFPVPVDDLEVGYEATTLGLTAAIRPEIVWHSAYVDPKQMTRSLGFILCGDNAFGNDRWKRSSPPQRLRLVISCLTKLITLLEPVFWPAFILILPGQRMLFLPIIARYVVPPLLAARELSHLVKHADVPIALRAPNVRDTAVAAIATPGIRLIAWAKGHFDCGRKYAD